MRTVALLIVRALALAVLAGAVWLALPAPPASAATSTSAPVFFVDQDGDDAAAGTRRAPWRTLEHAVATAPEGATVRVREGTYAPFTVTKAGQRIQAEPGQAVVVAGAAGVRDVVLVTAPGVRLIGLTVTGCVPDPDPVGGFEDGGSSGIRIDDEADGVLVRGVTVRDSHGVNSHGLPFGCYGILVHGADGSVLSGNDISGNGAGIYFNRGGQGARLVGNTIHDNDVIIRNTPRSNDDFGGSAVSFTNLDAVPGPVASGNVITGNAGPSHDYVDDGGAFEIYNASNLRIVGNTLANNENVLETGTGPGGTCAHNTFSGNTASGRTPDSRLAKSVGMILRCATDMKVTRNSFTEIDWWIFTLEAGDVFATDVQGLTISGNTIDQWQKVYHLGVDAVANEVVVDRNQIHFTGPIFSSYVDGTTSPGVADWRTRSGLDMRSAEF